MPSVGSSLTIVVGAASTCFVRDLRSIRIAYFKSLYPWWVVSQLLGQSAPLESEGMEEKVEVLPRIETMDGEVTVKARKKMDGRGGGSSWFWPTRGEMECG